MTAASPDAFHPLLLSAPAQEQDVVDDYLTTLAALLSPTGTCPAAAAALSGLTATSTAADLTAAMDAAVAAIRSADLALAVTVPALLLFTQLNLTGPLIDNATLAAANLPAGLTAVPGQLVAQTLLTADGEVAYHMARMPMLLALAFSSKLAWWHARSQRIRQLLLDNPAASVRTAALDGLRRAHAWAAGVGGDLLALWELEMTLVYQLYKDDRDALGHLGKAAQASGFEFEVSGLLGKRTKFQQNSLTQLVVLAESKFTPGDDSEEKQQPQQALANKDLQLNDETLLDKVALEGETVRRRRISSQHIKQTNPHDAITTEQLQPYIRRLLENPNNFSVHSLALLWRSRLESAKSRTVERAMLQLQTLVDQITSASEPTPASTRLHWLFALQSPTHWSLETELAEAMLNLGLLRSALEIYERLELWEKVAVCYLVTERKDQAEKVVLAQLESCDAALKPKYLCLLGDIRHGDVSLYWESWEVSGHRFARAMRSLGQVYFKTNEYVQSVECYQRALAINPLFDDAWFICGCAALQCSNWDAAQVAFARCTSMDHQNAEAWNNLATVLIKQGKKPEAFQALAQGVKAKYDSWKMWTNYMYLAMDLGALDEAMRAMQRVVEVRSAHADVNVRREAVDVEVLNLLVRSVMQLHLDKPVPERVARLAKLMALCTGTAAAPGGAVEPTVMRDVWLAAANFEMLRGYPRAAIEAHVRAFRAIARDTYEEEAQVKAAVEAAKVLIEAYQDLGDRTAEEPAQQGGHEQEVACKDWAYQSKLVVRGLMGRIKRDFEDTDSYEVLSGMLEAVKEAER
ncbi:hypothetical protein BCR44DRAFT_1498039 [Catenaria anguillulae PL171]|uniref:Uncharacterized protein n=1 Tax=Catenaria anguillulae PL171 TaxID=765915 RepID=A0A1Y2HUF4_9FUNG|nr:hypothetical protein BCR44DRAFT_1498039 [Catenaria anguillulae PL171]